MDEDFVRKIFVACDKDQDGFLDRFDLEEVGNQIGIEENISEILEQFGVAYCGKISYSQFCEKSSILFGELNHSSVESSPDQFTDTSLKRMEKAKDSKAEAMNQSKYMDDMADLDLQLDIGSEKLRKITEAWDAKPPQRRSGGGIEDYLDEATLQHLEKLNLIDPQPEDKEQYSASKADTKNISRADCFQISEISKQVHLAALTSYENKIHNLTNKLHFMKKECDKLRHKETQHILERQKMQHDFEEKLQSQQMRITELQSVIAELTRKLNKANGEKILEEDEEAEEQFDGEHDNDDLKSHSTSDLEVQGSHADCSDCSCENCNNQLEEEGPNQVNFKATAQDVGQKTLKNIFEEEMSENPRTALEMNNDLQNQLHRVLGALESRIENRRLTKIEDGDPVDHEENKNKNSEFFTEDHEQKEKLDHSETVDLIKLVESLQRDKRTLEKQLHVMNVQGYVYQKGNTVHVDEEFKKLHQEISYLRSKLKKSQQELEEARRMLTILRDERERRRRKGQELLADRGSPVPSSNESTGSGHRRSNSAHLIESHTAPSPNMNYTLPRSCSPMVEKPSLQHRSHSVGNRPQSTTANPYFGTKTHDEIQGKVASSTLLSSQNSAFSTFNAKGYALSPGSSSRYLETSDLGSSTGEEIHYNDIQKVLVTHLRNRIPESLLQSLLSVNNIDQIIKMLVQYFLNEIEDQKREGLINVERAESRLAHVASQNDLLQLSLEESKQNSERLSYLCGKYESNSTAWSLALQSTENLIETYEVLLQLQESEADIFAVNCQAAGIAGNTDTIKSLTSTKSSISNISVASSIASSNGTHPIDDEEFFKNTQVRRKDAESHAKFLLLKLDKMFDSSINEHLHYDESKCDDLSYQSRTSTGSSQNSVNTDALSKDEELRLRDYVRLLKRERGVCKSTVVELESIHQYVDNNSSENTPSSTLAFVERSSELNLDLETAVLLQELQGLKEQRAELKHRIYLLEKEKRSLELKMSSREAQEQAYIVHIEHLKSEVKEQIRKRKTMSKDGSRKNIQATEDGASQASGSTHSSVNTEQPFTSLSNEDIPVDMLEASRRERKLKQKIQNLLETLEKLSKNSAVRQHQTAEYISDLKRANGALVTAYEKAKKRHASRLKKFEQQLVQMAEKYQLQMRTLKEQIAVLKEAPTPSQAETSL